MPTSVSLAVLACLSAAVFVWVFQGTSNQIEIRRTKKKIQAHLMEFRLYGEEPGVLWNAQKSLLRENARYFQLLLRPALLTAFPAMFLLFCVEQWFGRAALPLGVDSVFTVQFGGPANSRMPVPVLRTPPAILVNGPPVRVLGLRQMSWRLRPLEKTSGLLRIELPNESITRRVEAGTRLVAPEMPVRSGVIEWARIYYPPATIEFFGLIVSPVVFFSAAWLLFTVPVIQFCR